MGWHFHFTFLGARSHFEKLLCYDSLPPLVLYQLGRIDFSLLPAPCQTLALCFSPSIVRFDTYPLQFVVLPVSYRLHTCLDAKCFVKPSTLNVPPYDPKRLHTVCKWTAIAPPCWSLADPDPSSTSAHAVMMQPSALTAPRALIPLGIRGMSSS